MYFLINPAHKRRGAKVRRRKVKKGTRAKVARRRVRRTLGQTQKGKGSTMARRRRRRSVARHTAPRRRRRRRSVVVLRANPPRRRRRRRASVALRRHHRRRFRRNPGGSGIVATIKQGVMDGALVLVGQTAQGRASALVARVVPVGGVAGAAIADIGSAVAVTMLARKFLPGRARMVSAGAFANAVRRTVTAFAPSVGSFLGDGEEVGGLPYGVGLMEAQGIGAYIDNGMGAYPGGGLGEAEDMSGYVVS